MEIYCGKCSHLFKLTNSEVIKTQNKARTMELYEEYKCEGCPNTIVICI